MRSVAKRTSLRSVIRIALTLLIALAVLWAGWANAAPTSQSPVTGSNQPSQPQVINPPLQGPGLPNQTGVLLVVALLIVVLVIGQSLRPTVPPQYVPPPPEQHAEGHHPPEAPHTSEHH